MSKESISYVVGEEKRLCDIIGRGEVLPLLQGTIRAGAVEAFLADADGEILWRSSGKDAGETCTATSSVFLEGEPVGRLGVRGGSEREELIAGLAALLADAVNTMINANLKRMLTTEIHTSVVTRSYEDLMETNRRLASSEARYRELSENLEKKVEARTEELRRAHTRLLQQEKMASIGQLAAGVAHEINNPLGFITSNLATLHKYVARFLLMLDHYRLLLGSGRPAAEMSRQAEEKWRELRLDMIRADVADLLSQSLQGAERVKKIVADLKGFSHVDDAADADVDLNAEIDRTLSVLHREIPPGARIDRIYQPLPSFICNGALLCQVFFNIIQNALNVRREGLQLEIRTWSDGAAIHVGIRDNGPGVPAAIRGRIFEPFFTTKEVGAGTGMGLAVAYDIIAGYGGAIVVDSPSGGGALFSITLPLKGT